jgi:CheY-like chemotaxis protein
VGSTLSGTPAGAVIDVSISRVDGELQLTVCDPGPVFAERDITLLSASAGYAIGHEAADNKELLPLQLRLARALLLAQGGRVWAHNATDKGKAVSFALRLHEGEAALENTNGAAQDPAILLVDSDLAFRRELQEILVERGYRVETAENGLQAWQFLLGNPAPALILFDLMLPAMDGWELHAAIKAHETLQTVPTVVVSGLDRYRIEASLPDAQGYIEKPIRTAQLFEVVQRHVAGPARPRTLSVRPASCL